MDESKSADGNKLLREDCPSRTVRKVMKILYDYQNTPTVEVIFLHITDLLDSIVLQLDADPKQGLRKQDLEIASFLYSFIFVINKVIVDCLFGKSDDVIDAY